MCNQEDKELLKSFLNRTFFKDFQKPNDENKMFSTLELQLTSKCNLNCIYCYYNQQNGNGKQLNPPNISTDSNLLFNLDLLLDYFYKNEYYPDEIELFGGEVFSQSVTFKVLDKLLNFYQNTDKWFAIVVPSNMSFLRNNELRQQIIRYMKYANDCGGCLSISASVDGVYMDKVNRPVANKQDQDRFYSDEFYNDLFAFSKQYGCGFHPMIHYNNIDKWKNNFLWFQKKFDEYNINWGNIYLLEVRDDGWTSDTIKEYGEFYKFVLNFALEKIEDSNEFVDGFIFNGGRNVKNYSRMNMFNNIVKSDKGLGCSLQTTLHVRLGDLTVNSCHRLSYDAFNGFKFVKNENENKIIDVEPLNLPFYLTTGSLNEETLPYCESCLIKSICGHQCLGSQFDFMGDPFTPIPSVCLLQFEKIKAQIEFLKQNNMFGYFLNKFQSDVRATAFKQFNNLLSS